MNSFSPNKMLVRSRFKDPTNEPCVFRLDEDRRPNGRFGIELTVFWYGVQKHKSHRHPEKCPSITTPASIDLKMPFM